MITVTESKRCIGVKLLAEKCGCSHVYISRVLHGHILPSPRVAAILKKSRINYPVISTK